MDATDSCEQCPHPLLAPFSGQHVSALTRELREELGFDLQVAVDRNQVSSIDHFGEAITPAFQKPRFNAHYFKIELNKRPDFKPDDQEIAWSGWVNHQELYRRYLGGEALMVLPVINSVRALAEDISVVGTEPFNLDYDEERSLPCLELIHGVGLLPIPSNTLPPARFTNALLLGDAPGRRFLVDPSPCSDEVYRKLMVALAEKGPLDGIFISHHHSDHHERAPQMALDLNVPLFCSAKTLDYLQELYPAGELERVACSAMEDGEELTRWKGEAVRCYTLPGHDDGMMGLAPDNLAWYFIADLAQDGASVVIPEHGGDMGCYFDSLKRVIDLAPEVLIPSHGFPRGGTYLLSKTLAHRQERERQVRYCLDAGMDVDEIVAELYADVEPRLKKYARYNVRQHIRKLAQTAPRENFKEEQS